MTRGCFALIGILLTGVALAQATVKLTFPSKTERYVVVAPDGLLDAMPDATIADSDTMEFPLPPKQEGMFIFVGDQNSGSMAKKSLAAVKKAGKWDVKPEDFVLQFALRFRVEVDGERAKSASILVKVGSWTKNLLIGDGANGEVELYAIPKGPLTASVTYQKEGKNHTLPPRDLKAAPNQGATQTVLFEGGDPNAKPPVTPDTLSGEEPPAKAGGKETTEAPELAAGYSPIQGLINFVIGLAIVGGIGYGLYRYFQANKEKVEQTLKNAGLPGAADPTDAAVANAPEPPKPLQPIVLDSSSPVQPDPVVGAAMVAKNPRLVSASGELFLISDGLSTVGRESADILLAGQSSVSRNHAKLERVGDSVMISDEGSTNGTFVNGAKVSQPTPLRMGDTVQFGSVQFRFEE